MLTVLTCLVAQVVEHLFGAEVLTGDLLGVHEALTHGKKLMLAHLNHLCELTFLLVKTSILLLLFSKFRCGVKEKLEVLRVSPSLKHVNLSEQLLLLLL